MKNQHIAPHASRLKYAALLALLTACPLTGYAAPAEIFEIGAKSYITISCLLIFAIIAMVAIQRRFSRINRTLRVVTGELDTTRRRLTETSRNLEQSREDLKDTNTRYEKMLVEARVGIYQVDAIGRCVYVNGTMYEISGLYQKKAAKEGIISAVHPEDQDAYRKAWDDFVQGSAPFNLDFRFRFKKGRFMTEVFVHGEASKILNAKKVPESYICWFTEVTHLQEKNRKQEAETNRYRYFLNETAEGCYQLLPEAPIPLIANAERMADAILGKLTIASCNQTFASLYGAKTDEMLGKSISELQGGCGPFKNKKDIAEFIANGYRAYAIESVRQDTNGNLLNLMNDVIGLVENDCLIGIWGTQRNISREKREKTELSNQVQFMHRILDTLPADVYVKDTRCRYLYASRKLAERTGITREEWIGKTIFEVIPGTPRDHDHHAIETMKSNRINRMERPFEARGKSGWMEAIQIPLVSEEGLVEGVVGLSLDISGRRKREEEIRQRHAALESVLNQTRNELNQSRGEYGKAATALADALDKLKLAEAEKQTREHLHNENIEERKRIEETLRQNEANLLKRQHQLEEQLARRMEQLASESDKRAKWEELLQIRDEELRNVEDLAEETRRQLEETEDFLKSTQQQLIHMTGEHAREMEGIETARQAIEQELNEVRSQLAESDARTKAQLDKLTTQHESVFSEEHKARIKAEKQLEKTDALLQTTQQEMKEMTARHAHELEVEIAERKAAAEKLVRNMAELDETRQQFHARIDEETKSIKQQLAQKQIREKAIRQHEKDMEEHIRKLEKDLRQKTKAVSDQMQLVESVEVEKKQTEERLEQFSRRQQELVARETQNILQLQVAEIRLNEVKLRKDAGALQRQKESMEQLLEERSIALEKAIQQQHELEKQLGEARSNIQEITKGTDARITTETTALKAQLKDVQDRATVLQDEVHQLQQEKADLAASLNERDKSVKQAEEAHQQVCTTLSEMESRLVKQEKNQETCIDTATRELRQQLARLKQESETLVEQLKKMTAEKQAVEEKLDARSQDLSRAAREYRKVVEAYQNAQARLKQITVQHEENLAEQTGRLNEELGQLRKIDADLKVECETLRSTVESDRRQMESLTAQLETETKKREATESDLQQLQAALTASREEAEAVVQDQLQKLRGEVKELNDTRRRLQEEKEEAVREIERRDAVLEEKEQERRQMEARMAEIEQRLNSLREEHQAELRKEIAEAKEISRLNDLVVDELKEALQETLNPVIKTTQLIESAPNLYEDQKKSIAKAGYECRKLIDIMNYRSELTHIADGTDAICNEVCDLHEMMTDIDRQFTHRADTKKLFFAVSFSQYQAANNVPRLVETDTGKLRKILSILLGYAMEQTDKGRLGLHATRHSSSDISTTVCFELAFTGRQSSDALLNAVFGPEQNKDETVDVKYGLTLARRYIGLMNGSMDLEYRSGGITAITLQLPLGKTASNEQDQADDETKAGAA